MPKALGYEEGKEEEKEEEEGEDGEGCGMRSKAPGEGGCAHPRERCTPPPRLVWRREDKLFARKDPNPPPIPPRGLSGSPRPAEGVIGGREPLRQ